jgi:hypothetical protein
MLLLPQLVMASSAIRQPSLESRVCPAAYILIGRLVPTTYREKQTCSGTVSYFQTDFCTEASVELEVTEVLHPSNWKTAGTITLTYLPLLSPGLTLGSPETEQFLFFLSQEKDETHVQYRLMGQNQRLVPLNPSQASEVRRVLASCP